jgi:hypothetical protein
MRIELKKFGEVLTARPAGKEAFAAILPTLDRNAAEMEVDFSGIISLSPSWADKFFPALKQIYGDRMTYLPSNNPSVKATLSILSATSED